MTWPRSSVPVRHHRPLQVGIAMCQPASHTQYESEVPFDLSRLKLGPHQTRMTLQSSKYTPAEYKASLRMNSLSLVPVQLSTGIKHGVENGKC